MMPKLIIDNLAVEVAGGTTVLEAAKKVGIWIPHFCYHPALGSVGACRLCAVKLLDGPVKGVQMSCMLPAQDGMVVSTTDAEALQMRQLVIEWLMLNHPHDCPVCDEGGECLLQDYTIAGGHGIRRFQGKKRTHQNQFLGPHIEHEMNRCIQCYRCVRFYQDYAGGRDFGVMGSAARVYYGRFSDGELESPFSGNLVDICPTGVFTDKTARFRARYWDYAMAPSICPHCSLGCNTTPAAFQRELLKTMARRNDAVNGWFICDKGRFANAAVNDPARLRTPVVDGAAVSWDMALDALTMRIGELLDIYGPGSLAVVGSPRLSLEGGVLLPLLALCADAGALCYFIDQDEIRLALAAVTWEREGNSASQADISASDCIVLVGCDLLQEGGMLALALRQAWRKGGKVFAVADAEQEQLSVSTAVEIIPVATLAEVPFADSSRAVIICGAKAAPAELAGAPAGVKFAALLSGPNSFGAALLSQEHGGLTFTEVLASGGLKGVIAFEADIPAELLSGLSLYVAADWQPSAVQLDAQIFFPTTAWVEMDGTFISNEGRAQRFCKVMQPGLPLKADDPVRHPPRQHCTMPPGSDLRPAWQVIAAIIARLGGEPIVHPLSGEWESLKDLDPHGGGVRFQQINQPKGGLL